jgi:cystathionine beta-synthase
MEFAETIGQTKLIDLTAFIADFVDWASTHPGFTRHITPLGQVNSQVPLGRGIREDVSVFAKCEYLNPTGSIKDRIVRYIVDQAEKNGHLKPGDTLIESTSGNTGAAVARIAALKGYKAILVIPDRVSQEKQAVLRVLGAEVRMMPHQATIDSPDHYVTQGQQLTEVIPNSFYINQYHSQQNPDAHYYSTGPEIWEQMSGNIDVFVSVAGSGGTISGVGRYLKEQNPYIKIIAADPVGSIYYHYFTQGSLPQPEYIYPSRVEGAGEDHLTAAMDFAVIDEVIQFHDVEAFYTARWLAKHAGILAGGSSGANIWTAVQIAQQAEKPTRIITLLPDYGMKYLSKFYSDPWMQAQGLL